MGMAIPVKSPRAQPGDAQGEISSHPLVLKLQQFTRLSYGERSALRDATGRRIREVDARQDLTREGDPPTALTVILSGWACRYKRLEDGRRQIVGFLVPGDMYDMNVFLLRAMDHSVGALTPVTLAEVPRDVVEDLAGRHPRIAQAMWWDTLVSAATQREWILNLGQRDAFERLGHMLCELFMRLDVVGLTHDGRCELPIVQTDMAEATGLSAVHVNRTLQELRSAGLIVLKGRSLTVPNLAALQNAALFNPNYLHLRHEGENLDATE